MLQGTLKSITRQYWLKEVPFRHNTHLLGPSLAHIIVIAVQRSCLCPKSYLKGQPRRELIKDASSQVQTCRLIEDP